MTRIVPALVVASALAAPSLAQANLPAKPSFETGNFTGLGSALVKFFERRGAV